MTSVVGLLADAQHASLAALSQVLAQDYEGLTVAARAAKRAGRIPAALAKKLERLDVAAHFARHITAQRVHALVSQINDETRKSPSRPPGVFIVPQDISPIPVAPVVRPDSATSDELRVVPGAAEEVVSVQTTAEVSLPNVSRLSPDAPEFVPNAAPIVKGLGHGDEKKAAQMLDTPDAVDAQRVRDGSKVPLPEVPVPPPPLATASSASSTLREVLHANQGQLAGGRASLQVRLDALARMRTFLPP